MKKNEADDIFNAIRKGDVEKFERLCNVENIDSVNVLGQSFLHIAISSKQPDIFNELIALGIHLDVKDNNGKIALHYAATHQDFMSTICLVGLVDKDSKDKNGNTPLFDAYISSKKDWNLVNKMIELGCNPNIENNFGNSVCKIAEKSGNQSVLDVIRGVNDEKI